MKSFIFIMFTSLLVTFYGCGGAAKKEKALQESIANDAQKTAEKNAMMAWNELLFSCKDEQKDVFICSEQLKNEVNLNNVIHLVKRSDKIKADANSYETRGKRKVETGYLLCIYQHYNQKEKIVSGNTIKVQDTQGWIFSTDEKGNILDALKIYESLNSTDVKETDPNDHTCNVVKDSKDIIFEVSIGRIDGIQFKGEKIRYKLDNGKFKEISRKKASYEVIGD